MLSSEQFLDDFESIYTIDVVSRSVNKLTRDDNQLTYYQCGYTWDEARGNFLYISCLVRYAKTLEDGAVIWFLGKDPYKDSKPFEIIWVGITASGSISLVVKGQKTDRIVGKWTIRLQQYFKRKVNMVWEVKKDD